MWCPVHWLRLGLCWCGGVRWPSATEVRVLEGGRIVSEISGVGPGKITQTYAVDPEHHQLRITTNIERGQGGQPRTVTNVYNADTSGS